jgi:hypothetical protein
MRRLYRHRARRQEALAGNYGTPLLMRFGSILQGFWGLVQELAGLEYGDAKEV